MIWKKKNKLPKNSENTFNLRKIKIRTNKSGKVEIIDEDTGIIIKGVNRITLYVNSFGKVCADLSVKNIQLDLDTEVQINVKKPNAD